MKDAANGVNDVNAVADVILREGLLLYPYRTSALKNRYRWTFGALYPKRYCQEQAAGDASSAATQCLVELEEGAALAITLRFLQDPDRPQSRCVALAPLPLVDLLRGRRTFDFSLGSVCGSLAAQAEYLGPGRATVSVCVANDSKFLGSGRQQALELGILAAQLILHVEPGAFVSLINPPAVHRLAAASCQQGGLWPVLAGTCGDRSTMLASPIILPDYPMIAGQSPGDLFDATEIDEILRLRILTLTEAEKVEARSEGVEARALIDATEKLPAATFHELHAVMNADGTYSRRFGVGARVRLKPQRRADIFDVILAGMTATIVDVELDFDDHVHYAVTIDDDPGNDLGLAGKIGHRFFFSPEEVEGL